MIKDIYQRLNRGETIYVKADRNGVPFEIRPAYWERIRMGITIVQNGKIAYGYNGAIIERERIEDMAEGLEEAEKGPNVEIPEQIHHKIIDLYEVEGAETVDAYILSEELDMNLEEVENILLQLEASGLVGRTNGEITMCDNNGYCP